ncbi:MAG: hypothetical protein PHV05_06115 [Candidatus Riflebacteria bacterium]|nr:hypothetical protein [Candidatus Riflebacteria bacterium]
MPEAFPVVASSLASTVQPFEDYAIGEENEGVQQILVSDYTVIVTMASKFAFQVRILAKSGQSF